MKEFLFMLLGVLAGTLSINADVPDKMKFPPPLVIVDDVWYYINFSDYSGATVIDAKLKDTDILKIPESVTYEDEPYPVTTIMPSFLVDHSSDSQDLNPIRIIEVPKTVEYLLFPFDLCSAKCLEAVNVDENNLWFSSYDGILYYKDYSVLIACPGANPCISFAPGVKEIRACAFEECIGICEIEIPSTVTKIGSSAFCRSALTKVTFPSSLKYIGECAFQDTNLTSVRLGAGIEHLGRASLAINNTLESIYCESTVPVQCEFSPFSSLSDSGDHIYNNVTLYVPVGCADAYRAAPYWGNIKHIEEYDYSSNIPVEAARIDIRAEGGAIVVSGNDAAPVEVYRTDGTLVRRTVDARIDGLPRGLYIVKVADTVKKISL